MRRASTPARSPFAGSWVTAVCAAPNRTILPGQNPLWGDAAGAPAGRLLVPGHNCWRVERAHRLAVLIDGASYFAAVRSAIAQATRSVFILGWDFDSRIRLVPRGANDGYPEALGEFLMDVVGRRHALRMYILSWDFAVVFALHREWMPLYKLGWRTQPRPRLSFRLDDTHPLGGSHHQKVVVVDDAVAFVGGLDLTHGRWDTPRHRQNEPNRRDAQGRPSRPNHDVQAIVDGAAARALGDLCRDRWRRATRREPVVTEAGPDDDPWPRGLVPEVADIDVAIARTDPGWVTGRPVEEIHRLYVDAVASATRSLYLENQYFSSSVVGAALAARLRTSAAPEVLVVSRLTEEGWLEERTMGVLRARLHSRLVDADTHGRYRLLYPHIPGLVQPNLLNVHSKVLIMDDDLCSIGSANFNNRSMGFDTECNIAFESGGQERIRRVIAGLRHRLLGEHLNVTPEAVARETARQTGRLIATVDALKRPGRTLEPINPTVPPEIDRLVPPDAVVDPERPADPETLINEFVPPDLRRPTAGRLVRFGIELFLVGAFSILIFWTPLGASLLPESLTRMVEDVVARPWMVWAAYIAGGMLFVPVTWLIIGTCVLFGPLPGGLYALGGVLLSAAVLYGIGRSLGRDAVRRLAGSRLNDITLRLAREGMTTVAMLRLLPVAPFSSLNAVAGASHVRLRDFLLGTAIGMAPGIAVAAVVVDRVRAAVERPGFGTVAGLTAVMVAVAAAAFSVWHRFGNVTPAGTRSVTAQQAGPPEANTEECRAGGASY